MLAAQVAGGRWEVVGGHRPEAGLRQCSGASGSPAHPFSNQVIEVPSSPRRAGVAHPRLDDAEVLADDDRAGPLRLERQDAHERLVVVAHIRPRRRGQPLRHPPHAEQPDDVVDPQATGVPQHPASRSRYGGEAGLGQPLRVQGRLRPVLADLVERVRRRADRAPTASTSRSAHASAPSGWTPTARSCTTPIGMPGGARGRLRRGQLLLEQPLQPHVEVDQVRELCARPATAGPPASRSSVGPGLDLRPVGLRQRAPGREVEQPRAFLAPGTAQRRRPFGRQRDGVHELSAARFAVHAASRSSSTSSRTAPAAVRRAPRPRRGPRRSAPRAPGRPRPAGRAGWRSDGSSAGRARGSAAAPAPPRAAG